MSLSPQEMYAQKMQEANELKRQIEASNMAGQAIWIDLRLKCLDLAVRSKGIGKEAIEMAIVYEEYVKNGSLPILP